MTAGEGPTLTDELVAVALDGYDAREARRAGGRALFDHLACLTAGLRGAPAGLGDAGAAAALDRDDLHWPSVTHPGAIVWTVLRATDAQGVRLWHAAHAGYEVTARLGRALGADHRRYWHATTTAGTVGGAVAAALALGVDPAAAADHAISVTGGSIVALLERSDTRLLHRDHAAATALLCARAAGMKATRNGLEHPRGLFAAMGGSPREVLDECDSTALSETTFRLYSTSGFTQALVEAAAELAEGGGTGDGRGLRHDAGEPGAAHPGTRVLVEAPAGTLAMANDPAPRTPDAAWWSAQHAVAATLAGRDAGDPDTVRDSAVRALRERIDLQEAPVYAVTVGGRRAERASAAVATDADLIAKWRALNPDDPPPLELLVGESPVVTHSRKGH